VAEARRSDWRNARNLLCVRVDNLGDVLMTTPAIRALRSASPGRRVTLLASRSGAAAARHVPEIDSVIGYEAPWVKRSADGGTPADLALIDTLVAGQFDAAIIFTVYSQSPLPAALMCRLAGIPLRLAHCRENPYDLLTDWIPESEPAKRVRHEVRRQLDLVATVGAKAADERLSFVVTDSDRAALDGTLRRLHIERGAAVVALHPGASAPSRRYPAELYSQAVRELLRAHDVHVVVTGGDHEREIAGRVCAPHVATGRVHDLAGALDLGALAALLERADVLVSNNTGPVHLAAALGTAVVDLYALTNPQHAPWRVPHRLLFRDVPCRYCYKSACPEGHHRCLRGVAPAEIVSAVGALLLRDVARATAPALPVAAPARGVLLPAPSGVS
jgi:lipopolysaccharide heptosyltransferase II